jgi:addiction module RelE/StbE family toxin
VIDRFNDERLRCKEQAPCAAYLSLKNRELQFNKQRKAVPLEIKKAFQDTLAFFIAEPDHPSLRNHPLKDKFAGVRSIDVTGDGRALYRRERERIIFVELGTHDQLYGENS